MRTKLPCNTWLRSKKGNLYKKTLTGKVFTVFKKRAAKYGIGYFCDGYGMRFVRQDFLTEWSATSWLEQNESAIRNGRASHLLTLATQSPIDDR